jgi:hypothetical protein
MKRQKNTPRKKQTGTQTKKAGREQLIKPYPLPLDSIYILDGEEPVYSRKLSPKQFLCNFMNQVN